MQPTRPTGARSPRLHLPLIVGADASTSSGASSLASTKSPQSTSKLWSYYHRDCVVKSPLPWSVAGDKKTKGKDPGRRTSPMRSTKDWEEASVVHFLDHNRTFLNGYVTTHVPQNDIEAWLFKKITTTCTNQTTFVKKPVLDEGGAKTSGKELFLGILGRLPDPSEHAVTWELARRVTTAVDADACRVYKLFPDHPRYVQYFIIGHGDCPSPQVFKLERADASEAVLVLEVAENGTPMRLSRADDPERFPVMPQDLFSSEVEATDANYVLYVPILASDGRSSHVLEIWRREPFNPADEDISSHFLVWASLTVHYCNLYLDKKRERNMSDFLLDVVKAIFEEMVSLDQLIKRILEFAQRLVNADRASLFLVDYRNFELVSTVFDLKFEPGQNRDVEKKEIRMPINRGIAGHVALSGETMNIPDAYSDYRFNREVDEKTGYKTISILCMPIKVQGKVIGVVQMVNKRNDNSFHHEDEVAFEIFSTFFGLALHHARLYDRIMRKEQKYKVALEVLSYHNTCRENEVRAMIGDKEQINVDLNDFYCDPYKLNEFEKCKAVVNMFNDLFDMTKFDIMTVTRFILTVKKNYRTVPYHNFDHGWSVAHSMYVILKNDVRKRFNYTVRLALFVACLCHDLDHRGYTNKYMSETASPLAAMYSTSTLEHHHFNITVTILQQDGHNIFAHISSEEYKEILGLIRQCILATDLAAFFPNLAKMKDLHEGDNTFNWTNCCHRELAMAISMTAADLSASAKPWEIQIKTVKVIFEEFYDQGDKEREAGRTPIPMMDRNKPDEQPDSQVGFLSQICIPCYKMLYKILPRTKPMIVMALKNLYNWKSKAQRIHNKSIDKEFSENSEIQDESEEVLLEDEDEKEEDEEGGGEIAKIKESDTKETETEGAVTIKTVGEEEDSKTDDVCWEEEEASIKSEKKIGGRLSKDIEGVSWIDEDGVVIRSNGALKVFQDKLEKK